MIAFAGVSLCRLFPSIGIFGSVKAEEFKVTLNTTIIESVDWLRSVAISEDHIAFKFAEIIHGLHSQTLRRERRREANNNSMASTPDNVTNPWFSGFVPPPPHPHTNKYFNTESPRQSTSSTGQYYDSQQGKYVVDSPSMPGYPLFPAGVPAQQGFGQQTAYDDSYFLSLFPELMGSGFVDGGYAAGIGQSVGGNGFEDSLGLWGFTNSRT